MPTNFLRAFINPITYGEFFIYKQIIFLLLYFTNYIYYMEYSFSTCKILISYRKFYYLCKILIVYRKFFYI